MENQESTKNKESHLIGLLGSLKDKFNYCLAINQDGNPELLVPIFNSLSLDFDYQDSSGFTETDVICKILENPLCPKEIIQKMLPLSHFKYYYYIFTSPFVPQKLLLETFYRHLPTNINVKKQLTQTQLNYLYQFANNPSLPKKERRKLEQLNDKLSSMYDDCLLAPCVKNTLNEKWLCQKFADYVKSGSNLSVLFNIVKNPLSKAHMLEYAVTYAYEHEKAMFLINHPNISISALELLQRRFPKISEEIEFKISQLSDLASE